MRVGFFGIGNLELLWVLIIALVLLGPARMIDAARSAGKYWREAQHLLKATADSATIDLDRPIASPKTKLEPIPPPEDSFSRNDDVGGDASEKREV